MPWHVVTDREQLTEWERADGNATIRLREGPDGWTVRFDRLHQAPEGSVYRHETVPDRETAMELVDRWREAFDASTREPAGDQ